MNIDELDFLSQDEKSYLNKILDDCHKGFLERINMTEEEYSELCKPYLAECSAYTDVIKSNKNRKSELHKALMNNTARVEKSIGGKSIHRGFYCPSPVQDIVIGNNNRGRLCRADNPKADYTYYFDSNNKHIATQQENRTEYISYYENKSLGLLFSENHFVSISECEYDENGRISSYINILCNADSDNVFEYDKELYTYNESELIVDHSHLAIFEPMVLSLNKYIFSIENGYLKSYRVDVFDTENISKTPLKSRTYKVKIKRKI